MSTTINAVQKVKSSFPVRNIKFDFDPSTRYWFDQDPLYSHFLNTLSAITAQGELFLIRMLRTLRERITDPVLQADISAFIGQEAMHAKEHTRYHRYADLNDIDIETFERQLIQIYSLLDRALPLMDRMAIGCAIEHCNGTFGAELLRNNTWNQKMVGPLRNLWLWHAVEENEHKAVFFDAYHAAGGGYIRRMVWMVLGCSTFAGLMTYGTARLLVADKKFLSKKHLQSISQITHPKKGLFNITVIKEFLDYVRPSFHPFDYDTKQLEQHWHKVLNLENQQN
ncbi:metal-dependent hydrolase [Acinetobacter seifertii]|uniref:metal-dependent hydrolase n=1 Tax=Acinetobacter seifertii TaxID=1530123 RepID=UPI001BAB7C32|nr:metal-dependent hydrolase [Acinetobacter seifertii]